MPRPLRLPPLLHRQVESYAAQLLSPPGTPPFDFAAPAGAPALVGPDSVSWQVFRNPVTMFIGGITAVLLELAEPRVRHGVWEHSNFRDEPLLRLQRTGLAAMITVYAPEQEARAMIAGVTRLHARVSGTTPAGERYDALDPDLLTWVQATAASSFLEAHLGYVRMLEPPLWDLYWTEAQPAARLFGAADAPTSNGAWQQLLDRMRPRLGPSPIIGEFLDIMRRVPILPRFARPAQRLLLKCAVSLLPPGVAEQIGLDPRRWHTSEREHRLITAIARTADRLVIRTLPAVQACRRLGLSDDYLHRR